MVVLCAFYIHDVVSTLLIGALHGEMLALEEQHREAQTALKRGGHEEKEAAERQEAQWRVEGREV